MRKHGRHTGSGRPHHSRSRPKGPSRLRAPIIAILVVLVVVTLTAMRMHDRSADTARAANQISAGPPGEDSAAAESSAAESSAASAAEAAASAAANASASAAAASSSSAAVAAAAAASASEIGALQNLASGLPAGAVSVAALNTSTGASYQWGATGAMLTGSIVKLYIIETLLIQKQNSGGLSSTQQATAVRMIENSDNDAAETLFEDIGGRTALLAANAALGLVNTTPGPGDYWGLTQTCASDYITLLKNLVTPTGGPLNATSQAYVLGLMRSVEADQRWGVGVTADAGTDFANKNGWLAVDDDNDLWLVNSTGVVTIKGQQVLMVVLTQHDSDFQSGIDLTESLAKALAPLVVS